MPLLTSRARHILQPLKPLTLSIGFSFVVPLRLFGSTTNATDRTKVHCTRRLVRQPSPAASRESPYPIVFLRMRGIEGLEEDAEWVDWASMFSEKGYTSVEIDISSPSPSPSSDPASESANGSISVPSTDTSTSTSAEDISTLKPMVNLLASEIRLLAIPFPPILVAFGGSTILAQAFIEDNPSSGLILINPAEDTDPRSEKQQIQTRLKYPTFTYEPHFPILVLSDQAGLRRLSVTNRLVREYGQLPPSAEDHQQEQEKKGWFGGFGGGSSRSKGIEIGVLDELTSPSGLNEKGRIEVERWMDRQGF
ncbi:uncharacterized protein I303_104059 [Kwoniella dejecticola CBS 10117]|uniref:Uncharacterized protein n=1 Tax=Kwoniella dejecticola CBS 10117 TaxID=1296121 RepID=A0A1A6A8G5_9TREE|nr:uncharacterized protein I303_04078 [Kwoniella dejecticola CBS 10117]OBR86354.1 hypothetical protein I303_04078 [Kwoniella dejecticola CBS 10117]